MLIYASVIRKAFRVGKTKTITMKNLKKIERKELKSISGGLDKCYDLRDSPDDPCQELNDQNNGCYRMNSCTMLCTRVSCLTGM